MSARRIEANPLHKGKGKFARTGAEAERAGQAHADWYERMGKASYELQREPEVWAALQKKYPEPKPPVRGYKAASHQANPKAGRTHRNPGGGGYRAPQLADWCWMPGMLLISPDGSEQRLCEGQPVPRRGASVWPDLDDPATLGCLLALVRKKHGRGCRASYAPVGTRDYWVVDKGRHSRYYFADEDSEGEALVAALEQA